MPNQYFTTKINLSRIKELNQYLLKTNFKAVKSDRQNIFNRQFEISAWKNERTQTLVSLYNKDYNLVIETIPRADKETYFNSNLIKKILEIVESEKLVNGVNTVIWSKF